MARWIGVVLIGGLTLLIGLFGCAAHQQGVTWTNPVKPRTEFRNDLRDCSGKVRREPRKLGHSSFAILRAQVERCMRDQHGWVKQ